MKNKTGTYYYETGDDFLSVLEALIDYHRSRDRDLEEIYANPEQLLEVQEINGIPLWPDPQMMRDHFWFITYTGDGSE